MNKLEYVQKIIRYLKQEAPEIEKVEEKPLIKDFDLSVILSYTCGALVTPGDSEIEKIANQLPLAWYVNDWLMFDTYVPPKDEPELIKQHILKLHPELSNVKYDYDTGLTPEEFVKQQKAIFGDKLPICPFGYTLDQPKQMMNR